MSESVQDELTAKASGPVGASMALAATGSKLAALPDAALRCLWIARELPFPMNTGDRIYTGNLARAFAQAGTDLTFVGLETQDRDCVPSQWPVRWRAVPGRKKSNWSALFSTQPLVSAAHATGAFRATLSELLGQTWDIIVVDHYGSSWVLDRVLLATRGQERPTVVVHVSQNHEASLAESLFRSYSGALPKRLVMFQNYLKIRHWENRLVREVDLVTAITAEDANRYRSDGSRVQSLVLTPGYSGPIAPERTITPNSEKRVVMVGSYRWLVKQENLRNLLVAADARFHERGITLDVIGDVPSELMEEFKPRLRATQFHGFVDDIAPYFANARLALVPEVIGGGFKLKFLDYIFGRVPIATITEAAAGLPGAVRAHMISGADLNALIDQVETHIERFDELNRMQRGAFLEAATLFDWRDRGSALKQAALGILVARLGEGASP